MHTCIQAYLYTGRARASARDGGGGWRGQRRRERERESVCVCGAGELLLKERRPLAAIKAQRGIAKHTALRVIFIPCNKITS